MTHLGTPWRTGPAWRTAAVPVTALLLCALPLLAGCGGSTEPEAGAGGATPATAAGAAADGGLLPIPMPGLDDAEAGVRRQIEERKAAVDRLRDEQGDEGADLAEAYGELGMAFLTYEFSDAAEAALQNAHRLAPDDMRWSYLLGYLYQNRGDGERARRMYEAALEQRGDYLPALVRLGRLALAGGDATTARRRFDAALRLDPASAAAHEGLGRVEAADGDDEAAIGHFRHALEKQPKANSLHYLLGQALRREGDLAAARKELAQAGEAQVQVPDPVLQSLAGLAASAQFYIVQGSEALEDGHVEVAAAAFRRALEIAPDNFTARKGMGYTLEKLGDVSGAEEQLRRALDGAQGDERAEAQAILGSLLITQGHDDEAVGYLTASLESVPDQPGTRVKLADALARLGRMQQAVRQYDRLLADDPEYPAPLLVRRATARINLGQADRALADFRRALEIAPDDAGLRLRYAEALDYLGRPGDAEAQRRRARELSSEGDAKVARLAGEGRLKAGRGDFAGAVASYRQAVELAPERHDVRTALAAVLGHMGRYDEALAEYRKVIEAAPDHEPARRGEIAALLLSHRYGLARVRLNEAMSRFTRDKGLALTQARLLAASPDPRVRDGNLALQVAQRVFRDDQSLPVGDTLALALAASGRVADAAELQRRLVAQAESAGQDALAAQMRDRLATYESGQPWVAPGPEPILEFVGLS